MNNNDPIIIPENLKYVEIHFMEEDEKQINRLRYYDYSNPAYYFLTLNSYRHRKIFGYVKDEKMHLSKYARIVNTNLLKIPKIYQKTELDELVEMPNHIHLKLIVNEHVSDAY